MKIGDVCVREVVHIEPTASLHAVAELMRHNHVGSVLVANKTNGDYKAVGIITDRDLVVEVIAERVDMNKVVAEDIMTRNLTAANENEELWEAVDRMHEQSVRRVPVVDDLGHLVGIFCMDDLLHVMASQLSGIVKLITHERRKEANTRR